MSGPAPPVAESLTGARMRPPVTWAVRYSGRSVQSVPSAAVTKDHKLGGIKQQKCILSRFWRAEVRHRGVGRAMLLPRA